LYIYLKNYIRLLRPHQWIKNAFVFTGLIFAHAWNQPQTILSIVYATIAFCLMSSSIYIINDILDMQQDKLHPTKKHRPLAAGIISIKLALPLAILLFIAALATGYIASIKVSCVLLAYAIMNILYCIELKHLVIIDVFIISFGFMLRIIAGTWAVGIAPSQWLMLCGLMITLFLGFTKRRAEISGIEEGATNAQRKVLDHYSPAILDKLIGITATGAIITYSLYTVSPSTIQSQGTANLIYTVPFVMYGIFRYIYLLHNNIRQNGEDTASDLLKDKHLLITVFGWFILVLILIH
jgi:4-hydroxybenzoate polyprenyltransferase